MDTIKNIDYIFKLTRELGYSYTSSSFKTKLNHPTYPSVIYLIDDTVLIKQDKSDNRLNYTFDEFISICENNLRILKIKKIKNARLREIDKYIYELFSKLTIKQVNNRIISYWFDKCEVITYDTEINEIYILESYWNIILESSIQHKQWFEILKLFNGYFNKNANDYNIIS